MKVKIAFSFFFFFATSSLNVFSQTHNQPNIGLKNHETLEITKIAVSPEKTTIYLEIENHIEGGYFCADKNIYITYPDGGKVKLINAVGIPQCPDSYKFKSVGEKLQFTLTFPPLKSGQNGSIL